MPWNARPRTGRAVGSRTSARRKLALPRSALANDMPDPDSAPRLDAGVWHRILTHVRLTNPTLNRVWFDTLVPRQLDNGSIHVTCRTVAELNFLSASGQQPFNAAAQAVMNRLVVIVFCAEQPARPAAGQVPPPLAKSTGHMAIASAESDDPWGRGDGGVPLSPDCLFENFIVGPGNQMAQAASMAVADKPGEAYNPLFLHGLPGLGKTHLLQSICQRMLEKRPDTRILFLSCDAFISRFMAAVEAGDMVGFRNRHRSPDVLVIDDIHFLQGHNRIQEEFFHTFNALHQQGKQIVLSADAAPKEIPEIEERLVSRFVWGLDAHLTRPCFDTRAAILRLKAKLRGLSLRQDVVNYIAAQIDGSPRELEGALMKVQGLTLLARRNALPNVTMVGDEPLIDVPFARQALGDTASEEAAAGTRRVSVENIINAVVRFYDVKLSDLHSRKRSRSIAFPRQVCMYLARMHTKYSLDEIGSFFGGRDHTTILHGVRTISAQMKTDAETADQVATIEQQLGTDAAKRRDHKAKPDPKDSEK